MPSLQLSWAAKLRALIVLVPLVLVMIAGLVVLGLDRMSAAYQQQGLSVQYQSGTASLVASWARTDRAVRVTEESFDHAIEILQTLVQQAEQLVASAQMQQDVTMVQMAQSVELTIRHYAELRHDWLQINRQLQGEESVQGLSVQLDKLSSALSDATMGMVGESERRLFETQQAYLQLPSAAKQAAAKAALVGFTEEVRRFGWQETVVGETLAEYAAVYNQIDQLLQQRLATEEQLAVIGSEFEQLSLKQEQYLQDEVIPRAYLQAKGSEQSSKWLLLAVFAGFAVAMVGVLLAISRTLGGRIRDVSSVLSEVARGNFLTRMTTGQNPNDEFNRLGLSVNTMIDDIAAAIGKTLGGTHSLESVKAALEHSMELMSENHRVVDQVTTEVVSAGQQIGMTLHDISQRTVQVGMSAQTANRSVQEGGAVVEQNAATTTALVELIKEADQQVKALVESNNRVSGILDLIDGLAEQTNLLALNAAIEAARAGEAGRGFAVVADEVRSLAQKTGNATRDIGNIVKALNSQCSLMEELFNNGMEMARQGEQSALLIGGSMSQLLRTISDLTEEVDQVVVAVDQVNNAAADIGEQMAAMGTRNQETGAIVEQLDGHNRQLVEVTQNLSAVTRQFTV